MRTVGLPPERYSSDDLDHDRPALFRAVSRWRYNHPGQPVIPFYWVPEPLGLVVFSDSEEAEWVGFGTSWQQRADWKRWGFSAAVAETYRARGWCSWIGYLIASSVDANLVHPADAFAPIRFGATTGSAEGTEVYLASMLRGERDGKYTARAIRHAVTRPDWYRTPLSPPQLGLVERGLAAIERIVSLDATAPDGTQYTDTISDWEHWSLGQVVPLVERLTEERQLRALVGWFYEVDNEQRDRYYRFCDFEEFVLGGVPMQWAQAVIAGAA